jgi:hypothetical protein
MRTFQRTFVEALPTPAAMGIGVARTRIEPQPSAPIEVPELIVLDTMFDDDGRTCESEVIFDKYELAPARWQMEHS